MTEERPRSGVDPQLLFGISLLAGLVLAWPALSSAMHGHSDIVAAGARLLLSIAAAWACGFFLSSLIGGYAAANAKTHNEDASERRDPSSAAKLPALAASSGDANIDLTGTD